MIKLKQKNKESLEVMAIKYRFEENPMGFYTINYIETIPININKIPKEAKRMINKKNKYINLSEKNIYEFYPVCGEENITGKYHLVRKSAINNCFNLN